MSADAQDPPRQFGTDWLNTVEERGRPPVEASETVLENVAPVGYVVVHEWNLGGETQYGTAGSIWPNRGPVENHLAYCQGMQERERPGSEGRYFIAAVYDDTAAEWAGS